MRSGLYDRFVKRAMDILISVAGLVVLSPVLLVLGLIVCVRMGWPPLFAQERTGLGGRVFRIRKFRTMRSELDANGDELPDSERLTGLGRFLRATSLDELPELYNVAIGDMSLVGPRPLLPRYVPYYTASERKRHDVRPGITGLAQIHGRNLASWDRRFALDLTYIDTISFAGDLRILIETVGAVFGRRGAVADPSTIMRDLDVERGGNRCK